jgi:predicted amidohydrolase
MRVIVAAVQMVSGASIDKNFVQAAHHVQHAADKGAHIVVLPECFLNYGVKIKPDVNQQREFLAQLAVLGSEKGLWIIAGTYPLNAAVLNECTASTTYSLENPLPFASSVVVDGSGRFCGVYNKIHLFDAAVADNIKHYRESKDYRHGSHLGTFVSPWCTLGVAVCYDLRFPEVFRALVDADVKIIFLPSAFTESTGRAHWEVLLRARAIETQTFIVAANQGGLHENGRATWGNSMIVSPWGEVLSKLDQGEGVLVEELNLSEVDSLRQQMPVSSHRRL